MDTSAKTNVVDLRSRMGDRAAALLGSARDAALRSLPAVLAAVLDRADDALFDFVQKSGNSEEQQQYFETMRELRRQRATIESRYREQLARAFSALERGRPLVVRYSAQDKSEQGLSLVGADELEEQLALEQLAGALERRHASPLTLLNRRLATLAGLEPLGSATNPIGPGHIVNALLEAFGGIVSSLPPRLVIYKIYERDLQGALGGFYSDLNKLLAEVPAHDPEAVAQARRADMPKSPKFPHQYIESLLGTYAPRADSTFATSPVSFGAGGGSAYSQASPDVDELLPTLRALLAEYRAARQPAVGGFAGPEMEPVSAVRTLSMLQAELPQAFRRVVDDPTASFSALLKGEVLRQAQRLGYTTAQGRLDERGEESLELVGMLFDALLGQRNYERGSREQMARMVVPYAKASLIDQQMFALKAHPARRLLNTVAEACDGNRGETTAERELLGRVEGTVDRLVLEFNEDLAIFSELEGELRGYFDQHKQRVELAERRAAEAQRGKERLEEARAMANIELAALMGAREAPPAIDQFLHRYWTHHIAVVSLRDGVDSSRFQLARDAGTQLWNAFLAAENGAAPPPDLREHLDRAMASSGVSGGAADETAAVIAEVLRAVRLGRPDLARAHALPEVEAIAGAHHEAEPAKPVESAKTVAPDATPAEAKPELAVVGGTDTLDFDEDDVERIRSLAVGSWVEFIGDDGTAQPAKLSWVSPISSRLLFVNRRGMRLCASSAEELAVQVRQGKLVLRSADSAFERAMGQVLGRLRDETKH